MSNIYPSRRFIARIIRLLGYALAHATFCVFSALTGMLICGWSFWVGMGASVVLLLCLGVFALIVDGVTTAADNARKRLNRWESS